MKVCVTGGAGFIGSHLVERLLSAGHEVTILDNMTSGRLENFWHHVDEGTVPLRFVRGDVRQTHHLLDAMRGCDLVAHLAANTDNLFDPEKTLMDLDNGVVGTWNVLEVMRRTGVRKIVFASSASLYANAEEPRAETDIRQMPSSPYAASKLSAEAFISAWCAWFGLDAWVYRFGNVVGPRIRHGVHWALLERLREKPASLRVLGNGNQIRPFVHVSDLVDAILHGFTHETSGGYQVWNLAPPDTTTVATVAAQCIAASPYPEIPVEYSGGEVGWRGDVKTVRLDPGSMAELGWWASMTSDEASQRAATELAQEVFS